METRGAHGAAGGRRVALRRTLLRQWPGIARPQTRGLADAQCARGVAYASGEGVEPDFAQGMTWRDDVCRVSTL